MKKTTFTLLFIFSMAMANAQQQGYKSLLDTFCLHSKNNFKDIMGGQTDTASVFYASKLKAGLGEIKIGKFPAVNVLSWEIPLRASEVVQTTVQEFIKVTYQDNKQYQIVSDGTQEEGYITTNVYGSNGSGKPPLVFQTIYYRNNDFPEKSSFTVMVYGK